jgi:isoleucyl-tRNA synthetase
VWFDPTIESEVAALLRVRSQVNEAIEPHRAAGKLGKSLDAVVTLNPAAGDLAALLVKHQGFLPELFIVSQVTIGGAAGPDLQVSVRPCAELGLHRCPRCWRWVPALATGPHGETCPRCTEALQN